MASSPSSLSSEVIVILGGTGTIGQHLVKRLCEELSVSSQIQPLLQHIVRVVTRDVEKAKDMFATLNLYDRTSPVVIEIVKGAVEDIESLSPIFEGATRLFLLTLTSLQQNQYVIERGILALLGLDHGRISNSAGDEAMNSSELVVSSFPGSSIRHVVRLSAHSRGMEGQPSNSPFRWHSECDEQLMEMCDPNRNTSSGGTVAATATAGKRKVAFTILRPSLFLQDMTRRHFAPLICEKNTFYQLGKVAHGLRQEVDDAETTKKYLDSYYIAMVDARDIADVAACVLSQPCEKHDHNTYILCGPESLSWGEVARAISKVAGRTITATMLSDKDFYTQFGNSHVYLKQMQAYRAGCGEDVDNDIEVVTGHPPRSVDHFCRDYADYWKAVGNN